MAVLDTVKEEISELRQDLNALAKALGYTFHTKPEVPEKRVAIKEGE